MQIELAGYRLLTALRAAADADPAAPAVPAVGGPAQVWSGQRLGDGLPVALKLFHPADAARASREAALTAAVDHPHVLPVIDLVAGAQAVALVTPLAAGGSLAALIAARLRLRWPEVLTVLIPLADVLAAAHQRDIVHGDVSCGNVLFDANGRPLLADLGAARAATECAVAVAATPTDVAPEVARGATPDPAADLFSLGSVALRALTGQPAWPAEDLQDVLIQSTAGQWPDPGDLWGPPDLVDIVRRLLDAEPVRRGSAAQAAVDLRRVGEPEPVRLMVSHRDGAVTGPAPATVVRPDAQRPPGMVPAGRAGARRRGRTRRARTLTHRRGRPNRAAPPASTGRHHRVRRWPWRRGVAGAVPGGRLRQRGRRTGSRHRHGPAPAGRRRRWWRAAAVVALVALLGIGAVRAGLWWAGWGHTRPTAVTAMPVTGPAAEQGAGRPDRASPQGPAPPSPSPSPSPSPPDVSSVGDDVSDEDWLAVMSALDAARAAALTTADPALLDEVYTADAPARVQDAGQISLLTDAGYHVTAAAHRVQSATLLGIGDDGSVTLRVVESMPSYPIVDTDGAVVGATTPIAHSVVLVTLRPTHGGFRIEWVGQT